MCPKSGGLDKKYVRIRTYNGKYLMAYAKSRSSVKTRCCGSKDVVGLKDVRTPGRLTTYIIHCTSAGNGKMAYSFEQLNSKNQPSKLHITAIGRNGELQAYPKPRSGFSSVTGNKMVFYVERWRGPVVAMKSFYYDKWVTFSDERNLDGEVFLDKTSNGQAFPNMAMTFSFEQGI